MSYDDQVDVSKSDILVVDDAPDNLRILSAILTKRKFRVRKSLNGQSAIASARANPPDIILLDVRMPEVNGYEICKMLKASPETNYIPVIFISALDDIADKVKAFRSGGIDYITKPFQEAEVLVRVENQLRLQKLQRQLIQRNEELARSNQELEQFAYAISHDLQQPLQTMIGFARLIVLDHQISLNEITYEHLHEIIKAGDRAQQLIQDLLSYAQVKHQNQNFEPVDCNLMLVKVLDNLKMMISTKDAVIHTDSLPTIIGNESQLIQLFQNLIDNAIKFSHPDSSPQISISATNQTNEWLFAIHDNGIGIAAQYLESIFEIFQRVYTFEQYPGSGIGLAICKKIVELHGGRIWVESHPNTGTTFYFTLQN
ncbi:MAG: ATP-binding protein [Leptolyngbyaceae cyanobacterium bins.302]|nr:ATP-binding protein [Leptolyngbyaceae cyanobacterium bins.302]